MSKWESSVKAALAAIPEKNKAKMLNDQNIAEFVAMKVTKGWAASGQSCEDHHNDVQNIIVEAKIQLLQAKKGI